MKLGVKWLRIDNQHTYKHCGHCHKVRSGKDTDRWTCFEKVESSQ